MALKNCKECGTEVSSKGVCPKCGKDQRNFFVKHKVMTFILVVALLGVIVGVSGSDNKSDNTIQTGTTTIQREEKFILESDSITEKNSFGMYIGGTIKNNTDKQYTYVQVTFNVYDANGAQLGTAIDNINNLEANGTWKYNAVFMGSDAKNAVSYKLVEIKGW